MSAENWLPITGYEGLYEVSDHGRVRGIARTAWNGRAMIPIPSRILTVKPNVWRGKPGLIRAYYVSLTKENRTKNQNVGPLVLKAFVSPRPVGMECCHGDGDNANNHLANLRWDTHQENMRDVARYGGSTEPRRRARGGQAGHSHLTEDDVRCIRAEPNFRGVCSMLARCFGVSYHTIWKIRSGDNWAHVL